MKYASLLLAAVLLAAVINPVTADEHGLPPIASNILRQPALSPDGNTLAFVYDGDIWTVPSAGGTARRLTITPGNEGDPIFSPDGEWIAFRSRRTGADCIYVMPAAGGEARRLTWSDSFDAPCAWLPDGSGIIFSSVRRQGARDLWVVRLDGSEPWPITNGGFGVHEFGAVISPDARHIAYVNRGTNPHRRRGYHGTSNAEIWICDFDGVQTSNHRRLTNNRSHNTAPVFISNEELLYVTYENGPDASHRVGRIVGVSLEGVPLREWGRGVRVDAREISVGGGKIAFSTGNYGGWQLHVGELSRSAMAAISMPRIEIATDRRDAGVRVFTRTQASEYAVSPDGKKIAFVAGGDVFFMPADENAVPAQVTNTVSEKHSLVWAPDSRHLAFTEKVSGTLMTVDAANLSAGVQTHDMGGARVSNLNMDRFGRLWGVINEERIAVVHKGEWGGKEAPEQEPHEIPGRFHGSAIFTGGYDFSPDGRWLTYIQPNELYNGSVVLADTHTGDVKPISFMFGTASGASFGRDGKRIVFTNNQEGSHDVYAIDLEREPLIFPEDKLDRLFDPPAESTPSRGRAEDRPPPATNPHFEGLRDRVTRLTTISGNVSWPIALSDGKTFFFVAQSNVWRLTRDPEKGPDQRQLTQSRTSPTQLSISADERTLWWLEDGRINSMPATGTNTRVTTYNFRVEQRRDANELRRAAFEEARWVMGNYFYDRTHHGIDWFATAERYRPALESVSTGDEYGELMNELLGELNASHQGYTGFDDRSDSLRETVGYLGVLLDPVELSQGRYKVTEVVKGGPLDLPENAPVAPFYITGLNGNAFGSANKLSEQMLSTAGRRAILHINSTPEFEGASTIAVRPITRGAEQQLWYQRWVEGQREMVERLSEGRLGYVHVRAMNAAAVREFRHHLGNAMLGREGVVIDVRYNGGGSTAVDLLEILIKRPWLVRQYGDRDDISENVYRNVALEKPSILMINDSSFSNAEIMAEGFRRLNIGQIVGVDTAGGVIGTGSVRLVDGSTMRLPRIGAFTLDGENLENNGRKPDIFVENHPDELDQGIDRQTEAAVKTLLAQLDE